MRETSSAEVVDDAARGINDTLCPVSNSVCSNPSVATGQLGDKVCRMCVLIHIYVYCKYAD